MTRTSAIFGVVSVLTAAIVGGVFIRKKIIDDILYEKELSKLETEWKKQVKELEDYISFLNIDLQKKNRDKENLGKEIEKHKKNIENFINDIKKYQEKIEELNNNDILEEKGDRITANINRQKKLNQQIQKLKYKTQELEKTSLERFKKLKEELYKLQNILKIQKEKLYKHADARKKVNSQLQIQISNKNETAILKEKSEKELKNNESLLFNLNKLIQKLIKTFEEKNLKLIALKQKNPRNI